jgi:ceramide glucosyltransferase
MSLVYILALILAPAWAYLVGTASAAVRFARRPLPLGVERPPISLLKPLHGAEPGLYENLRSFVQQDYPTVQIVLGTNDGKDGALPVANALIQEMSAAAITLVVGAPIRGSNLKVANLENMLLAACHGILVISDSDMRVDRRYLAAVTAPLQDRSVGLVTCLYEGVSTGGVWSDLGALHINFGFLPSALVASEMGIDRGCFGATIVLRRQTLERIGGFMRVRDELADDQRIGEAVRALGLTVVLSRYLVEARVSEPSLAQLWRHEVRWARTVRTISPAGYAGSVLTHAVAIAAIGAVVSGFGLTSSIFLVISVLLRWATARVVARTLGFATNRLWLLPVRDALSFALFVASFFGRRVSWRGQLFQVEPSGRMSADGDQAL